MKLAKNFELSIRFSAFLIRALYFWLSVPYRTDLTKADTYLDNSWMAFNGTREMYGN